MLRLIREDGTKVTDIGPEKAEQSLRAIIVHILMRFCPAASADFEFSNLVLKGKLVLN